MTDTRTVTPEQEYDEAQGLLDALEARVLDGDESVTSTELASARERAASLARFARLRQDAAVRREQAERAATRSAAAAHARSVLEPMIAAGAHRLDGGDAGTAARAKVVAALTELHATLEGNHETFMAVVRSLTTGAGFELDGPAVDGVAVDGALRLHLDGAGYEVPAGTQVAAVLRGTVGSAVQEVLR